MNDIYVFLGPTLAVVDARVEIDATYLPPVSIGDVYRLWARRPCVIGIVDGAFDRVPPVLHKEIMWIMERGVHVFGSAGIGALRAVELETFGMRGVGLVYQAFSDGILEQDDEVAVVHECGPGGYRALSEAMVNIRGTLLVAQDEKIISDDTRQLLTAVAKDVFYRNRNWPELLKLGNAKGGDPAELDALRRWLPGGRVDQQAADAIAMLREMRAFHATDPAPLRVPWMTANTILWNEARECAGPLYEDGR
jgi:hypothetical protein